MTVPDFAFRTLMSDETDVFRKWACDHWERGKKPDLAWHPVVREEWNILNLIDAAAEAEEVIDINELDTAT